MPVLSSPRLSILGLLVPPPCPKYNSFLSPGVASQEPRREEAICHVLHIICPLMAREQVGHQEVLGRRAGENQAGSPSAAQRNVETRSGISGWDLASCHLSTSRKPGGGVFRAQPSSGKTEQPSGQSVSGVGDPVGALCAGLGLASWPDSMKRARDPHNTVGLAQKGLRWAGKDQPTPNKFQENPNTRFHVLNKFTCRLQYSKCNFFFKKRSLNSESVKSNEMWWYLSCTAVI